jgi:hypothetical protein
MSIALEVHLGFAFFVVLTGLFVGWVQMGRRVMSAIIGIQILIGVIVAAWAGAAHYPLRSMIWLHIVAALIAMFAYIAGRRIFDRAPQNALPAVAMSLLGFLLLLVTAWLGFRLVYP